MDRILTLFVLTSVATYSTGAFQKDIKGFPDSSDLASAEANVESSYLNNVIYPIGLLRKRSYPARLMDILSESDVDARNGFLVKRSDIVEKKQRELAHLIQNMILKLDSEEAKNLSGKRRFRSVSGESSGEIARDISAEVGSKRKYGSIFHGPVDSLSKAPPRPRRQRKFRIDPVMFWMGIGK